VAGVHAKQLERFAVQVLK